MRHVDAPTPNSMPEEAMNQLLEHARLIFGEQEWSTWEWSAREYGTSEHRVIPFLWHGGAWTRTLSTWARRAEVPIS
jgi:hypothetical protein